jgi:hypothetical protein
MTTVVMCNSNMLSIKYSLAADTEIVSLIPEFVG